MSRAPKHQPGRYDGYDEGFTDGQAVAEQDRDDALDALRKTQAQGLVAEEVCAIVVAYFGDLATTMRELRDLAPRHVDLLKQVSHDIRSPTYTATWPHPRNRR